MLPFGVTIPATVPQGSENQEGLMNNPVYKAQLFLLRSVLETSSQVALYAQVSGAYLNPVLMGVLLLT